MLTKPEDKARMNAAEEKRQRKQTKRLTTARKKP